MVNFCHRSTMMALLKSQFCHIMAEMGVIQDASISHLPESREIKYDVLLSDLEKDAIQLDETLDFVRGQNNELDLAIEKEKNYEEHHSCVSEVLSTKLQEIEENGNERNLSLDRRKENIYRKTKKGEKYVKEVVKQLGTFAETHFPLPSEEAFNEVKKKLRSADRKMTHSSMISLKKILEILMNKCFDEPSDPYVVIDHRFWPPYVELLLRCQIVLRHPDDEQRIKLVPFNL